VIFGRPWWIDDAGLAAVADPLSGAQSADVVVVGGGFTGLWTALALREREPGLDVAIVEADFCGSGPSGRNGGFLHGYWAALPTAVSLFGVDDALRLARAGDRIIPGVRDFLGAHDEDAWLHVGGLLEISAAPAQDAPLSPASWAWPRRPSSWTSQRCRRAAPPPSSAPESSTATEPPSTRAASCGRCATPLWQPGSVCTSNRRSCGSGASRSTQGTAASAPPRTLRALNLGLRLCSAPFARIRSSSQQTPG
jgi:FAD dependent oxidoreductase